MIVVQPRAAGLGAPGFFAFEGISCFHDWKQDLMSSMWYHGHGTSARGSFPHINASFPRAFDLRGRIKPSRSLTKNKFTSNKPKPHQFTRPVRYSAPRMTYRQPVWTTKRISWNRRVCIVANNIPHDKVWFKTKPQTIDIAEC